MKGRAVVKVMAEGCHACEITSKFDTQICLKSGLGFAKFDIDDVLTEGKFPFLFALLAKHVIQSGDQYVDVPLYILLSKDEYVSHNSKIESEEDLTAWLEQFK